MKKSGIWLVLALLVFSVGGFWVFRTMIHRVKDDPETNRNYMKAAVLSRLGNKAVIVCDSIDFNNDGIKETIAINPLNSDKLVENPKTTEIEFDCSQAIVLTIVKRKTKILLAVGEKSKTQGLLQPNSTAYFHRPPFHLKILGQKSTSALAITDSAGVNADTLLWDYNKERIGLQRLCKCWR